MRDHFSDFADRYSVRFRHLVSTRSRRVAMAVLALLLLTEAAVRRAGLADFPIYRLDNRYAYVPQANQSGAFLGTNRWVFNDRHMGTERPWSADSRPNVLLVGNSIVMGGNTYDQPTKVGPLLQSMLGPGCQVWPVAAGGWSTVNEMRFLQAHSDVAAAAEVVVWELMAGQMESVHAWRDSTQHPTRRPWWATGHVARKVMVQRFGWAVSPSAVASGNAYLHFAEFERLLARWAVAAPAPPAGMLVLYPDQQQLEQARQGREWMEERLRLEQMALRLGLLVVDVARDSRWTSALYKDGVHPTVEGNRVLATLLAEALAGAGITARCGALAPLKPAQ